MLPGTNNYVKLILIVLVLASLLEGFPVTQFKINFLNLSYLSRIFETVTTSNHLLQRITWMLLLFKHVTFFFVKVGRTVIGLLANFYRDLSRSLFITAVLANRCLSKNSFGDTVLTISLPWLPRCQFQY